VYNYYVQQIYSNERRKDEYNLIQCERATLMGTKVFELENYNVFQYLRVVENYNYLGFLQVRGINYSKDKRL
jgi:hypothetical protein